MEFNSAFKVLLVSSYKETGAGLLCGTEWIFNYSSGH